MPTCTCKDTIIFFFIQIFIVMLSYIYDYLTIVNADIAVYKKRPSRPPRMRSGWLFDEVDVTVNTEGFYFLYSSILHVCSFVSLS